MDSIDQLYLEALRNVATRANKPKSSGKGWAAKEWTEEEKHLLKNKWLSLEETIVGTIRVNQNASNYHIADIVFRQHWRHKIPDDVWESFVENVSSLRRELAS
jgi:hypothetical protein